MTKREFLQAVIKETANEELRAYAEAEITKLDERNHARSSKPSKTQLENEPIKAAIVEFLTDKDWTVASAIGEALEISTQKASALCRQLVADKALVEMEVKIPKKGKQKAYMVNTIEQLIPFSLIRGQRKLSFCFIENLRRTTSKYFFWKNQKKS